MMRHQTSRLACFLLLGLPLAAQESIVPYLPKDTLMVMSAPDLQGSMDRFAQLPMAKMWAEDEVQKFVADLREMGEKMFAQQMDQAKQMHAEGQFPIDPADIMALRVNGFTLALTSMQMTKGDFGMQADLGIVAHLDFGASAPTWTKLLDMGIGMLEDQMAGMVEKTEGKVGDVRTMTFRPSGGEGSAMTLNLAMVPNGLLVTTLAPDLQIIVDGMQKKLPSLGAAADYEAIAKHMANAKEKNECEMFWRPGSTMKALFQAVSAAGEEEDLGMVDMKGVERAMNAMGLFQLGASRTTSSYVDGKSVTRSFEALAAGTKAQASPIDMKFLKWIPKDAVSFGSGNFEPAYYYDLMVKGLEAYDAELAKQVLGQLGEMEKQLGFSVRNDLVGAIGGHYVIWQMPVSTISAAPELALLVKADEAKLVPALKALAKATQGMFGIQENQKQGIKFYELTLDADRLGQAQGLAKVLDVIQPTFAFKDGYLVGSFSPNDIKRHFQRMDREDDPKNDIRSNKEFVGIAAQLPGSLESVSFTDWKSQFESLYQILAGVLAIVRPDDGVPIDLQQLPEAETLTKHLFAMSSYTTSDAAGRTTVTTSPFGMEMYAMLFAAGAVIGTVQASRRGF